MPDDYITHTFQIRVSRPTQNSCNCYLLAVGLVSMSLTSDSPLRFLYMFMPVSCEYLPNKLTDGRTYSLREVPTYHKAVKFRRTQDLVWYPNATMYGLTVGQKNHYPGILDDSQHSAIAAPLCWLRSPKKTPRVEALSNPRVGSRTRILRIGRLK